MKDGLNSKLLAVCDGEGRPIALLLTEGKVIDHEGSAALLDAIPKPTSSSPTQLRQRRLSRRPRGQEHHALHPAAQASQDQARLRPRDLQALL